MEVGRLKKSFFDKNIWQEANMVRVYFDKYVRYNSEKWVWKPYIYANDCSLEEQNEWNELYLKTRGRRDDNDKVMPDFYSIERDADQFDLREVTFTDIFGLKWSGKKGKTETIDAPDYYGSLYYWDTDDDGKPYISDYNTTNNLPDSSIYYMFNVGHPKYRKEWIDIANIVDIEYHYFIENHLFKDSKITVFYPDDSLVTIYDSHGISEFAYALKKFGKEGLYSKLCDKVNEHFLGLKNSPYEEDKKYFPGCSAEEYFEKRFVEKNKA